MVTPLHVYLRDEFRPYDRELTSKDRAAAILQRLGGTDGYTFVVLWRSDALDGLDDLDVAIGIAVARALEDPAGARVEIHAPNPRDRWNNKVIFVATGTAEGLRRYR